MKPFKLMSTLYGHTSDVKGLHATKDEGGFVSVSRDLSAKRWLFTSSKEGAAYAEVQTINQHTKYVNSVTVVYSVAGYPNGLIVTGSNDQSIGVYDIESSKTIAHLKEHLGPVCTLYHDGSSTSNLLYSGSFDSSAKVWNLNDLVKNDFKLKSVITIKEHEQTVWCVLAIDKRQLVLTASADKTIKQFRIDTSSGTYEYAFKYASHTDCVRGLALNNLNGEEFFSCANDGTVLVWKLDNPMPLKQIQVANTYLYSVNVMPKYVADQSECYFITSGEDRSLRVHSVRQSDKQTQLIQTLVLPCQTLWNAICLDNHNLVIACSDGSIRVFTQDEKCQASQSELEQYEKELAQFAIPVKANESMAQIKLNDLPGPEALSKAGKRDGQSIIINNNNEAEVYQWDGNDNRWMKIGVAVGSASSGGGSAQREKTTYEGKEYDYVFDIELDEQGSKYKLPYNVSEDPWHAAQKFIHKYELSQMFLDQIAQFIMTNTGSETIGDASSASTYYDPFTGENRYVPSGREATPSNRSSQPFADPFTGQNAYRTSNAAPMEIDLTTETTKKTAPSSNEHFPVTSFILFDQVNCEPVLRKFKEFHADPGSDESCASIEKLTTRLNNLKDEADFKKELDYLFQIMASWPKEKRFPVIDLVRILALNELVAKYLINNGAYMTRLNELVDKNDNLTNTMLALKVYCNLFKSVGESCSNAALLGGLVAQWEQLSKRLEKISHKNDNKSLQIAYTTLLLNYVVLLKKLASTKGQIYMKLHDISDALIELIRHINDLASDALNWDQEALYRLIVCYGTLISGHHDHKDIDPELMLSIAQSLTALGLTCETVASNPEKYQQKVIDSSKCLLKRLHS